ncbi:hypothetical protein B5K05_33445 [Rhizobium phaseoli]|nr:hypothetical protein [Rhizobium phaseoli]RDJ00778.1 hypothetical protein B5K05_33445 [Rhizobium phaseoli]
MAHDDPFTLDLFGNTALSSAFDIAGSNDFAAFTGEPENSGDGRRRDAEPVPAARAAKLPKGARPTSA